MHTWPHNRFLVFFIFYFVFVFQAQRAVGQLDMVGSGHALEFDGIDDYVDLGNIYDDVALPITLSVWIKMAPNVTETLPIFDSQDNSTVYNGFTFVVSPAPYIGLTYGDGLGGNNPAFRRTKTAVYKNLKDWMNITGVFRSGTDMDIYINGYNLGGTYQGTSTSPMNSNSPTEVAKIGYWFSNNVIYHFKGLMDDLRIWNRALTETEIRNVMCRKLMVGNEIGLIGYWDFNETSGNTVFDKSPKGFHGTLMGNPKRVFSGAPIGDESVFVYATDMSKTPLNYTDGIHNILASNVTGGAYGAHIYRINTYPSQTIGLDTVRMPYFGVFVARDNQATTVDVSYTISGNVPCNYYTRYDNSVPQWSSAATLTAIPDRLEFVGKKGPSGIMMFPNVITPDNGDLLNQYLVLDDFLRGSELFVYNRWGNEVYHSSSYQNNWDGANLPNAVYYYKVINGCLGERKGSLSIFR